MLQTLFFMMELMTIRLYQSNKIGFNYVRHFDERRNLQNIIRFTEEMPLIVGMTELNFLVNY